MLSNTCKYAIRACIYLALNENLNKRIGIKKIADDLKIPMPFLGKILQTLAKNKILSSTKGPNGGFMLGKSPDKITLMDIVEIIDGKDFFESCAIGVADCSDHEDHCPIHPYYSPIREQLKNLFVSTNISKLTSDIEKTGKKIII